MHHMLFACETGPKQQLSFECCDSKNDNLLCSGKTSMGVQCSTHHAGRWIASNFKVLFSTLAATGKIKDIKKRPWSTEGSEQQATVTFQPPAFLS
jgi:hypothetical protein